MDNADRISNEDTREEGEVGTDNADRISNEDTREEGEVSYTECERSKTEMEETKLAKRRTMQRRKQFQQVLYIYQAFILLFHKALHPSHCLSVSLAMIPHPV